MHLRSLFPHILRTYVLTEPSRHWDSRTAPQQPKKPTNITRLPAPISIYTPGETGGKDTMDYNLFWQIQIVYKTFVNICFWVDSSWNARYSSSGNFNLSLRQQVAAQIQEYAVRTLAQTVALTFQNVLFLWSAEQMAAKWLMLCQILFLKIIFTLKLPMRPLGS